MSTTKEVGIQTELLCAAKLQEFGCHISFPFGDDCRYDLIIDYNKKLYRVQCKTASTKDNGQTYRFSAHSIIAGKTVPYKEEEIDLFATIIKDKCYLIPIKYCPYKSFTLRTLDTKNSQKKKINFIEQFSLKNILGTI